MRQLTGNDVAILTTGGYGRYAYVNRAPPSSQCRGGLVSWPSGGQLKRKVEGRVARNGQSLEVAVVCQEARTEPARPGEQL